MRKSSCQAVLNHEVSHKGEATLEYHDKHGKPVYYCMGYIDLMYDEPLDTCKACPKFINNCPVSIEDIATDCD